MNELRHIKDKLAAVKKGLADDSFAIYPARAGPSSDWESIPHW